MKAPPAVTVTLERFAAWRVASALLGAAALACALQAGWSWWPAARTMPIASLVAAALLGASWGAVGSRLRPQRLGWNGRCWTLAELATPGSTQAVEGSVRLMIDLGSWLLLRFDSEPGSRRLRCWLPVQRGGLEPAWHALRCALIYSAPSSSRPAPDPRPQ